MMDRQDREALDRYITGNWGEDQFKEYPDPPEEEEGPDPEEEDPSPDPSERPELRAELSQDRSNGSPRESEISSWLFPPGAIVTTPGINRLRERTGTPLLPFLARHLRGDWGDLDPFDQRQNDNAFHLGGRILSAYHLEGEKIWIITEADRSSTTILLPEEY